MIGARSDLGSHDLARHLIPNLVCIGRSGHAQAGSHRTSKFHDQFSGSRAGFSLDPKFTSPDSVSIPLFHFMDFAVSIECAEPKIDLAEGTDESPSQM